MDDLQLKYNVFVPSSAVTFKYSRSGGKGGQHVNKVSTKVEASVHIAELIAPAETLVRIRRRLSGMVDKEGNLRVVAQESRSQWQNKKSAIEKITDIIETASREEKRRKPTAPTHASGLKRLNSKKKKGEHKSLRRRVSTDE
ncbi:MAG: alternative ribosome rescue aminoacyl-tRNA hydrolase ArfB [Bacteroidota bacterium]